eukprot:1763596-Amphidinium_carterae.1
MVDKLKLSKESATSMVDDLTKNTKEETRLQPQHKKPAKENKANTTQTRTLQTTCNKTLGLR